ncbi:DNA-protecting protein DprA [Phycicoccus endophyticus]|uniref:DNA-protecting protein DprA n=1 Tax=Phycicoccus endophyticus TaxID=1690220 RepID=A0A7G9QY75_9MICO|nr:DNA-processing protein DprA [Phycicoccus endophyticus]NHI19188.1 DNA-protecting protein DprA [Phycicoccus endophyticus]QNN48300.1 DNA-protecting protein DprA [Phycicoccus endophyticus]GGL40854.1 DNA processing protein DprA [Phycicoccus endophyticus]
MRPAHPLEREERWARVALSFLVEPKHGSTVRGLAAEGAVATLARVRRRESAAGPESSVRLPELDLGALAHAVEASGARVLVPGDPGWPVGLDRHTSPPYCLYVRGEPDLAALAERSVAVVGSRAASEYGLRVASELGEGLATRGWTVVSGAAYGIDAAAHRGALAAEGPGVAVLACGADVAYPRAHRALIEAVRASGAVVSEMPPGALPHRSRFLARNRVIALLARATVVVEAGLRSGSLSTAREAREHHLPVAAVPGPVTSATSAGCHQLLRETDAVLVTDTAEVAELAARIGDELAPQPRPVPLPTDDLDAVEHAVWSAAPVRRWLPSHRLAVVAGVDPARVPAAVAVLEALGLLEQREGCWRKTRTPPLSTTAGLGAGRDP